MIKLKPLTPNDREQFILDNQKAFNYGALEEFGRRDDHFEEDEQIISRDTIEQSLDGGEAYRILLGGKSVGGVIIKVDGERGDLEILFVSPGVHSKGIGYAAWCEVEKLHPEVKVWETVTPYFEKRNIHFYVNRCGFHIVEFYNSHHPDPNDPDRAEQIDEQFPDGMFRFEKHTNLVLNQILSRHSYRGKYKQDKVPREHLKLIMETGLAAPSGCNKQTTSLIAVDDPEVLDKLKAAIDPPVASTAPAMICVLTQRINAYRNRCFATQDYSAAIENMLLAITALGYQSCWYEGHITDEDRIGDKLAKILGVPDKYELVCILPVGVAEDEVTLPKKRGFEERAWFNGFHNQ